MSETPDEEVDYGSSVFDANLNTHTDLCMKYIKDR